MTFLSPQSGSDCRADLCRKDLGKCDTSIDNVPLAIPLLQSNSSPKCEGFVVPVCRHHGWCNGHVVIQMSFQPDSDKGCSWWASKSTFHFVVSRCPDRNPTQVYVVHTSHSTHLTAQTIFLRSVLSSTGCLRSSRHWIWSWW